MHLLCGTPIDRQTARHWTKLNAVPPDMCLMTIMLALLAVSPTWFVNLGGKTLRTDAMWPDIAYYTRYSMVWLTLIQLPTWSQATAVQGIRQPFPKSAPTVTRHFVPRSFRTHVISYHFGHFIPTFIFNLVISYPVWSFRTHFVPSLVISYLLLLFSRKPFLSFRTYFFTVSYPSHFVPEVISYPF